MRKKAFTLVELMVAMAIIGVLLGLAVYGVTAAQRSERNTQRKAALQDINVGIQAYIDSFGAQPTTIYFSTTGHAYIGVSSTTCPTTSCKDVPLRGAAIPTANTALGSGSTMTGSTGASATVYVFNTVCASGYSGYDLSATLEGGTSFSASSCTNN